MEQPVAKWGNGIEGRLKEKLHIFKFSVEGFAVETQDFSSF
jgi:hypothetical protein